MYIVSLCKEGNDTLFFYDDTILFITNMSTYYLRFYVSVLSVLQNGVYLVNPIRTQIYNEHFRVVIALGLTSSHPEQRS